MRAAICLPGPTSWRRCSHSDSRAWSPATAPVVSAPMACAATRRAAARVKRCNLSNSVGVCTAIPAGAAPATGHPSCGPDAKSSCKRDGTCDGTGSCHLWNNVVCKQGSCDPNTNQATGPSKCDGAGTCVTPNPVSCGPYVCLADNSACYPSCSGTSTGCKPPNTCNAGSCGPKPNGAPCANGTECATGNCSPDGYCCDTACTGKCEACDVGINRGKCTAITSGEPEQSHGVQQRAMQRHRRVQDADDELVRRLRVHQQRLSDELRIGRQQLRAGGLLLRLVVRRRAVERAGLHAGAAVRERLLRRRLLLQRGLQRQLHALRRHARYVHQHRKRHSARERARPVRYRHPLLRDLRRQWQLWQFPDD